MPSSWIPWGRRCPQERLKDSWPLTRSARGLWMEPVNRRFRTEDVLQAQAAQPSVQGGCFLFHP